MDEEMYLWNGSKGEAWKTWLCCNFLIRSVIRWTLGMLISLGWSL